MPVDVMAVLEQCCQLMMEVKTATVRKSEARNKQKHKHTHKQISFPSVLHSDTRHHYPVDNDGVDTDTVAVAVMDDPVSAAQSVYDRCKMLHIHTKTAGKTNNITVTPEAFKQLT